MTEGRRPRRRHVRKASAIPLVAKVAGRYDVRVIDISAGGARVEHSIILRPGDACMLSITVTGQPLTLLGRIVWSREVGRTDAAASRRRFVSGVAFDRLSEEARTVLGKFLGDLFPAD